jgi:hypothetical protein
MVQGRPSTIFQRASMPNYPASRLFRPLCTPDYSRYICGEVFEGGFPHALAHFISASTLA